MEKKILYMATKTAKKYGIRYEHGTECDPEEPNLDRIFNTIRHDMMRGEVYDYEIRLLPGIYRLSAPLRLNPSHSGRVTVKAWGGDAVLHGGRVITGLYETTYRGMRVFAADIPAVKNGEWYFEELYVNGEWRERPSLPLNGGRYTIESIEGHPYDCFGNPSVDHFTAEKGVFDGLSHIEDATVEVIHFWLSERMPVKSYDPESRTVRVSRVPRKALVDDVVPGYAKYRISNVPEGLAGAGQWYLERETGRLYYLPMEGETLESITVEAPFLQNLVVMEGNEEEKVSGITFDGITFACTRSDMCDADAPVKYATYFQAATNRDGAVRMRHAEDITLVGCTLWGTGNYGIEIGDGCRRIVVEKTQIRDAGAGGIRITGADAYHTERNATGHVRVENCHIHHCTRIDYGAIGIYVGDAYSVRLSHNDIHDLKYSGISVGWVWGMTKSRTMNCIIEYNHIHHLGDGDMSDMGGIYLLGPQGGTEVRGNYIHDIRRANYGGWGIYLDEGATNVLVEKNVVYDCDTSAFMIHYGSENIVRYNIFGFGDANVCFGAAARSVFATMMKNIFYVEDAPVYKGGYNYDLRAPRQVSDANFIFKRTDTPLHNILEPDPGVLAPSSFEDWKRCGNDTLSRVYRTDAPFLRTPKQVRRYGFPVVDAKLAGIKK